MSRRYILGSLGNASFIAIATPFLSNYLICPGVNSGTVSGMC
ncbi:hypothetical protein CWATWH0402_4178 [Crocosphaera watsonii WH 0402]|uniref:Uncharacterized protein n=1 Tax=Crocosphaera watsonii WH 0402 TaxID=1284629 RepID=T2JUF6_CROWT|nr:hypothetical protein [Crocosphaera watsonii]CCQ69443.1 hypothetical protein CWATWH0402_4178 [Crocosphaera watsonii WH 0402]